MGKMSEISHAHPDDTTLAVVLKSLWLVAAVCAGTLHNTLVIYTILKDKKLHRAPYYYMVNLSVADLLRSLLCLPFVLATVMHDSVWVYGSTGCKLLAFSSTFFTFGALFALFILAVDRHMSVAYHSFHARRFHGLMCLAIVLLGWGIAFILAFPPVFGLGTYGFIPYEAQCTLEHRHYTDNDTLGFTAIFVAIALLILFVYVKIFMFLRTHRRMRPILYEPARSDNWTFFFPGGNRIPNQVFVGGLARAVTNPPGLVAPHHPQGNAHLNGRYVCSPSQKNEKLTRVFFMVTLLFQILWMPYLSMCLWYMLDPERRIPYVFASVSTWLTYSQCAVLPLVYMTCHRPFRQSVSKSISMSSNLYSYVLRDMPVETY